MKIKLRGRMVINILFYDFEVFRYNWLVVAIDPQKKKPFIIWDDAKALKKLYESYEEDIWIGFNSRHYDQYILKGNYLIHRIIRRDEQTVTLLGDGNIGMTETATFDDIIGIMYSISRKGREWKSNGAGWRVYSWIWSVLTPLRRDPLGLWRKLNRKKVFDFSKMREV